MQISKREKQMRKQLLFALLCTLTPILANASVIYRVEQITMPEKNTEIINNRRALASIRPYYIGASYNYTMWQSYTTDTNIALDGKASSSFDIVAGLRIYDTFRLEANYINSNAKWDVISFDTDIAMMNLIWDARIDSLYRMFNTQMLVPYVGFGAGAAWIKGQNNTNTDKNMSPVLSAMAGISVEFNNIFALDFGYKYIYLFDGDNNIVSDFAPSAHQLRAGARIHF